MFLPLHGLRNTHALLLLILTVACAGCGGFFTKPIPQSITVGPASPVIGKGSTLQLTATAVNDDGSTSTLNNATWSSSNSGIATISSSGLLTAVATGTITITATSGSITGTTTVNVLNANLNSISITPANPIVASGQQVTFTATGNLADGTNTDLTKIVTWTSSNTSVATITSSGVATAATGVSSSQTTTITATAGQVLGSTVLTVGL